MGFNTKLFRLIYCMRRSQCYHSESSRNVHHVVTLSDRQLKLLATIRKHTLSGCCIVFTFLINCIVIIIYGHLYTQTSFFWISWSFSLLLGTFCLYLSFTVNRTKYDFVCKKCDSWMSILCQKIAQHKLQKLHYQKAVELNAMQFTLQTQMANVPTTSPSLDPIAEMTEEDGFEMDPQ